MIIEPLGFVHLCSTLRCPVPMTRRPVPFLLGLLGHDGRSKVLVNSDVSSELAAHLCQPLPGHHCVCAHVCPWQVCVCVVCMSTCVHMFVCICVCLKAIESLLFLTGTFQARKRGGDGHARTFLLAGHHWEVEQVTCRFGRL